MGKKLATLFFLALLLSVLGSCAYTPVTFRSDEFGQLDGACAVNEKIPHCVTCVASSTALDTMLFLAVSWRLLLFIAGDLDVRTRLNYFFGREAMPKISGTLLQGGQQYYLYVEIQSEQIAVDGN